MKIPLRLRLWGHSKTTPVWRGRLTPPPDKKPGGLYTTLWTNTEVNVQQSKGVAQGPMNAYNALSECKAELSRHSEVGQSVSPRDYARGDGFSHSHIPVKKTTGVQIHPLVFLLFPHLNHSCPQSFQKEELYNFNTHIAQIWSQTDTTSQIQKLSSNMN